MIFHKLHVQYTKPEGMNNPFDYEPDEVALAAAHDLQKQLPSEPSEGKMYGVLIVKKNNEMGYLAAYSGQITFNVERQHSTSNVQTSNLKSQSLTFNVQRFFVPAVFDYLQPDGYFKTHEDEITKINHRIEELQNADSFIKAKDYLAALQNEAEVAVKTAQERMKAAKALREQRRASENISKEEEAAMTKESQFLKAEVSRTKKKYKSLLEEASKDVEENEAAIWQLKQHRKVKSDALQTWLFKQFNFLNANGESRNLIDIFQNYWKEENSLLKGADIRSAIPSGAGECCEPKLLQYAFANGYTPLSMAMFWWGPSPKTEIRHHGHFYPACNGKCKPILRWMLSATTLRNSAKNTKQSKEGLEIVYSDADIVVVNKPSGMLSVPGKGNRPSVLSIVKAKYPEATGPMMVHRLDMATSGLIVVAKNEAAYINLQKQFAEHSIRKRYKAVLCPIQQHNILPKGTISLPLSPDALDRPRQKVDYEHGKTAITEYRVIEKRENGEIVIEFKPITGRTHQLRVHSAHPEGLNAPIKGDELYGTKADRLYLHAEYLEFTHPKTGRRLTFNI
ncbi:MAG: RluA family pseudouridine synthase [Prevotella sp.]|nr:RluA family pseudouridine synthase [Prevotella sp.]